MQRIKRINHLVREESSSSRNSFGDPSGPSSHVFSLTIIKEDSSRRDALERCRNETNSEWDVWPECQLVYL
jgi:hypothetical protein